MPEQSQARGEINELPVCWDFMPLGSPTFCMDSVSICLYANDAPQLIASAVWIRFGRDALQLIGQPSFQKRHKKKQQNSVQFLSTCRKFTSEIAS